MNKLEEMLAASKLNNLLRKQDEDEKTKNCIRTILLIAGAVAIIATIAYGVYRFFIKDDFEDFDDDLYFDDDNDVDDDDDDADDEYVCDFDDVDEVHVGDFDAFSPERSQYRAFSLDDDGLGGPGDKELYPLPSVDFRCIYSFTRSMSYHS